MMARESPATRVQEGLQVRSEVDEDEDEGETDAQSSDSVITRLSLISSLLYTNTNIL